MKIDYAIMSSNDNPLYLDFWEPVSKCWEKLGITPLLYYFGDKDFEDERVIKMSPLPNYSEAIQTLWIRYYAPKLLDLDKVSIISDIDMIPLSKEYFCDSIKDIDDDKYVHLNPCVETYTKIPSCYHVAKNSTFVDVLELDTFESFEDSLEECVKYSEEYPNKHLLLHDDAWFADENYGTAMLEKEKNKNIITLLPREGGQNGRRINRDNDDMLSGPIDLNKVAQQYYFDCHSIRPYAKHKAVIDAIVNTFIYTEK